MSLLDRLHTNISDVGVFASVALVFSLFKWAITQGKVPWKTVGLNMAIGITVGVLAGGLALELNAGDFGSIVSASAGTMLGREALDFIRDRQALGELAKRAAENIVDKVTK